MPRAAPESHQCPLCRCERVEPFAELAGRRYRHCPECGLVHLAPEHRLGRAAELAHYGTHENDPADLRYRAFLNRLAAPLVKRLPAAAQGLDYGAGPGPTLSRMLEEQGFRMELYDPFFAPDEEVLRRRYQFITCTETAEHFFAPGAEFERLDGMLLPGGWLGMMTSVLREGQRFAGWHYARDPTHVSFYRPATLRWIAARHGWTLHTPRPNVALFRKSDDGPPTSG